MGKQILIASTAVALLAATASAAGVDDKRPVGPPPRSIIVSQVKEASEEVIFLETTAVQVQKEVVEYKVENGRKIAYVKKVFDTVPETRQVTLSLKGGQVSSLDGKPLDPKRVWQHVKVGTPLLISADRQPIDAVHCKSAKPDTILLIPAVPLPGAPAAVKP